MQVKVGDPVKFLDADTQQGTYHHGTVADTEYQDRGFVVVQTEDGEVWNVNTERLETP